MLPLVLGFWLAVVHGGAPGAAPAGEMTVWLLTADPHDDIAAGAAMGADEMTRTASLLGRRFVLHKAIVSNAKRAIEEIGASRPRGATRFLLLDLDEEAACGVARHFADSRSTVVMNARVASQPCAAPMLLLRQPQRQRELALTGVPGGATTLRVDEWHPSLQRFGAQELNERYQRATLRAMTGDAWAGWFAIKAAAESALRLSSVDRRALTGPEAPSFDGHKGVPLRFDASGVLVQPVYIIDASGGGAGKVLKEVS